MPCMRVCMCVRVSYRAVLCATLEHRLCVFLVCVSVPSAHRSTSHKCASVHVHVHTHTHTHTHACNSNTHMCTHMHTHARAHTNTHTHTHTCMQQQHTHAHTHVHTHTHTHIHTHTHTHVPTAFLSDSVLCFMRATSRSARSF